VKLTSFQWTYEIRKNGGHYIKNQKYFKIFYTLCLLRSLSNPG